MTNFKKNYSIDILAAKRGSFVINDTDAHEVDVDLAELSSDAELVTLKYAGDDTNYASKHVSTVGNAMGKEVTIVALNGRKISYIELGAGSANCVGELLDAS